MGIGGIYTCPVTITGAVGVSQDVQEGACIKLATDMGCPVEKHNVWRDDRTDIDGVRPAFRAMLREITRKGITNLFVYSTDNVSQDIVVLEEFLDFCGVAGCGVHFATVPSMNGCDVLATMAATFGAKIRIHERHFISYRTKRGKRFSALRGQMPVGAGVGLYGYDYDPALKKRKVKLAESIVVERVFADAAAGKTVSQISSELNEDCILTRTGNSWNPRAVRRILKNHSYVGIDYYGKTTTIAKIDGQRLTVECPREEWIKITGFTPAIVSHEMFKKVPKMLDCFRQKGLAGV